MDFPSSELHLPVIGSLSVEAYGGSARFAAVAPASAAWPSANLAIAVPFIIRSNYLARLMWWYNGTAVSGNIDVGIYSAGGSLLVSSGSTAQSGTSQVQSVNITDVLLTPGRYYMAAAMDNTTGTLFRSALGLPALQLFGCAQMASAFALPDTFTFASIASDYMPVFGMTTRTAI